MLTPGTDMSRHFFILGSNPVLSIAEIIALLPGREFTMTEMYKQAAVVDAIAGSALDAKAMMERLGGTIKIGSIFGKEVLPRLKEKDLI